MRSVSEVNEGRTSALGDLSSRFASTLGSTALASAVRVQEENEGELLNANIVDNQRQSSMPSSPALIKILRASGPFFLEIDRLRAPYL